MTSAPLVPSLTFLPKLSLVYKVVLLSIKRDEFNSFRLWTRVIELQSQIEDIAVD